MKISHKASLVALSCAIFLGSTSSFVAASDAAGETDKKNLGQKIQEFLNKSKTSKGQVADAALPRIPSVAYDPANPTKKVPTPVLPRPEGKTPPMREMVKIPLGQPMMPGQASSSALREFDDRVRADRLKLMEELKTYPPDEKEGMVKEFQARILKEQKEFFDRLKTIPPGKKEQKRADFEKRVSEERSALIEKLKTAAPKK